MANTITLVDSKQGKKQFQGAFSKMWTVEATIDDQDAISATDTAEFELTVPGVALGDHVISYGIDNDLSDGTDDVLESVVVTAADTVQFRFIADAGAYAADDLNGSTVKCLIGRPNW